MKISDFIFMDFETNGLFGKITEISVIESINNDKCTMENFINLKDFLKSKFNNREFFKNKILVVWHPWMLQYIAKDKNFNKFYNKIVKSQIIIFSDLYAMKHEFNEKRYKIADMTKELLDSEHNGNAADDCMDLYRCFKKLNNIY